MFVEESWLALFIIDIICESTPIFLIGPSRQAPNMGFFVITSPIERQ